MYIMSLYSNAKFLDTDSPYNSSTFYVENIETLEILRIPSVDIDYI